MKTITKFILPRYVWFRVWFAQWFKNSDGIKAFAALLMNELVQNCMAVFRRLNASITRLSANLKSTQQAIASTSMAIMVSQDDFDDVRSKLRSYRFWIVICLIADIPFNFFLFDAVTPENNRGWDAISWVCALLLTGILSVPVGVLSQQIFADPKYGQAIAPFRNWRTLIGISILCIIIEVMVYKLCIVRSKVLEGANGDGSLTFGLVVFGMATPVIAGYLGYLYSLSIGAFNNYCRLQNLIRNEANYVKELSICHDVKQSVFKKVAQEKWSLLQEFKVYKNNYDMRNGSQENLVGHFSETHDSFMREASYRLESKELAKVKPLMANQVYIPQVAG